jgi:hypothetical protein
MVALAPLLANERDREFYDLAVEMGHKQSEAADFVVYVNQIMDNTSLRSIFPFGMRGPMSGAPRPPPPIPSN